MALEDEAYGERARGPEAEQSFDTAAQRDAFERVGFTREKADELVDALRKSQNRVMAQVLTSSDLDRFGDRLIALATERFDRIEQRFDKVDQRFDRLDGRVSALGETVAVVKDRTETQAKAMSELKAETSTGLAEVRASVRGMRWQSWAQILLALSLIGGLLTALSVFLPEGS